MQDIKFRAWVGKMEYDITTGKFGTFFVNKEKGDGLHPNDSASLTPNTTKYSDDTPVMQYTGLKDKNGNDIYEGDILRWRDSRNLEVKWGTVGWVLYGDLFKKFGLEADSCNEFNTSGYLPYSEIIGNVYENPELLTIENDV